MTAEAEASDQLLRQALDHARSMRSIPVSTYRLQFHKEFKFRDATAIIPYLSELGITHVYASPYLKARPGSTHGYDVIDHCHLNPELGARQDFDDFLAALQQRNMSHILDIVPNHVGIATNENVWWNDVLENGPASLYAGYFDINWQGSPQTDLKGRVLIATLGSTYGEELEKGDLKLSFENGAFYANYYDRRFPISPRTYPAILQSDSCQLKTSEPALAECRWIIDASRNLSDRCDASSAAAERHRAKEEIKHRLAKLSAENDAVRDFIARQVAALNGVKGDPSSFDRLDDLLRRQCFRLAYWRTAPDEINYRRFFDINDLAALAMERLEVFKATHVLILDLLAKGTVTGLRVDHPDGLYDPRTYFRRLQTHHVLAVARRLRESSAVLRETPWETLEPMLLDRLDRMLPQTAGSPADPLLYVLGEKILAVDETLPESWPIDGTSGYDFLNMVNGLFVDSAAAGQFDELYRDWTGNHASCADLVYTKKKLILDTSLASELNMLTAELKTIAGRSRYGVDYSFHGLLDALKELIACFPVYRSYIDERGASAEDVHIIDQAIECAKRRNPKIDTSLFKFIRDTMLREDAGKDAEELASCRRFAGKFQQVSSPVMAKGVEDTAFYTYNRLLSLNEVGGDPARFGVSPEQLHAFLARRQRDWPYSMSTLSTHDTKRSEDVRARLNVLSEMPELWHACLQRWGELNAGHKSMVDGTPIPARNDEYALYQAMLGGWPLDAQDVNAFKERLQGAMLKSMREAKVVTSWTDSNQKVETAVHDFIDVIFDQARSAEFLADFQNLQRTISRLGAISSLSQTLIKLTAPGIPDTYQGTELLDFSLVDPDNRRPVDYGRRWRVLEELKKSSSNGEDFDIGRLTESSDSSALKLHIHRTLLRLRRQYRELFTVGDYLPLQTGGARGVNVFGFARSHGRQIAVVVASRLVAGLSRDSAVVVLPREIWGNTYVKLPPIATGRKFRDALTGGEVRSSEHPEGPVWLAADMCSPCPVALLIAQ